jgi:hypothetical protein
MPVADGETQMFRHSFTGHNPIRVIPLERQRIIALSALKLDSTNTREIFFSPLDNFHH